MRHSADRYNFSTQLFDRRAVPHGRLSDQCKRLRFRAIMSAHDLENSGKDNAPATDTILQSFDARGFINSFLTLSSVALLGASLGFSRGFS